MLIGIVLVSCVLGYAQKLPCRSQTWQGGFQYSHACYNDVFPLYYGEGLADGKIGRISTRTPTAAATRPARSSIRC